MAANQQNQLMLLSDCLDKIRQLSNDTKINTQIQNKAYLELAEHMAGISRNANTCAGIFFDMYMGTRPYEEIQDKIDEARLQENGKIS